MFKSKVVVIAIREYLALVRTKAFLIGLFLAPVLFIVAAIVVPLVTSGDAPSEGGSRRVLVFDRTGQITEALEEAALDTNLRILPRATDEFDETERTRLNDLVRSGKLAAILEVGSHAINGQASSETDEDAEIILVTHNNAGGTTRWLRRHVRDIIQLERLRAAGIDELRITELMRSPFVDVRTAEAPESEDDSGLAAMLAPMITLMLIFMVIISTAPQLLVSVVEEKQQRISEVLLGSVSPSVLMFGKLLGTCAVGLTVLSVYVGLGIAAAAYFGFAGMIPLSFLALSLVDVLVSLVMFGSLFLAMGAASSELKDAQGMMAPVMVVLVLPMMLIGPILQDPNGSLAVVLSMFPLTAPFMLPLRLAVATVPTWEIVVSVSGAILTTAIIVWAAGRVFRVGLLAQGQRPKFSELLRWIREG